MDVVQAFYGRKPWVKYTIDNKGIPLFDLKTGINLGDDVSLFKDVQVAKTYYNDKLTLVRIDIKTNKEKIDGKY